MKLRTSKKVKTRGLHMIYLKFHFFSYLKSEVTSLTRALAGFLNERSSCTFKKIYMSIILLILNVSKFNRSLRIVYFQEIDEYSKFS